MKTLAQASFLVCAAVLLAGNALDARQVPDVDFSGWWNLQTSAPPPGGGGPCEFEGTAHVTQSGTQVSGDADLTLVGGPDNCPMELSAMLTGNANGSALEMGLLMGGQLGNAQFGGQGDDRQQQGTFQVSDGPYADTSGPFSAMRIVAPVTIPTLTTIGIATLILSLLAVSVYLLREHAL